MPNLNKVLSRLKQAGLHLNRTKCCFMMPSVEYLGYSIDKKMVLKVAAIFETPKPSNIQELQDFLVRNLYLDFPLHYTPFISYFERVPHWYGTVTVSKPSS